MGTDVRNVNRKDYKKIPAPLMLEMKTGVDAVYPDIHDFASPDGIRGGDGGHPALRPADAIFLSGIV